MSGIAFFYSPGVVDKVLKTRDVAVTIPSDGDEAAW